MQTDTTVPPATTAQTAPSTRQSHSLIASDRVEGTPVRRSSGEKIGTISALWSTSSAATSLTRC
jgi:hypothetical protein